MHRGCADSRGVMTDDQTAGGGVVGRSDGSGGSARKRRAVPQVWKPVFLEALRRSGVVKHAVEAAGIARRTAYDARERDEEFKQEWDEIIEAATDEIEREAVRRAVEGTLKPVFQHGRKVGEIREYSDRLLELLLKAHRPELYRENSTVKHEGGALAQVNVNLTLDEGGRAKLRELLRKRPVRFDAESGAVLEGRELPAGEGAS